MKILVVHSVFGKDEKKKSPVHMWRVQRPIQELKKHVDWQIDEQPTLIKDFEKYKSSTEFTAEEMELAFENVCKYDIVFSSYYSNPTAYTLLKVAAKKAGVQYVMDVDDDMFAIDPDNPFWLLSDDEKCYFMQCMIRDNAWITTTSEQLATVFRERRQGKPKDSVFVLPNYITDDYQHPKFDNGEKIVVGYFGGSSHHKDIHDTDVLESLQKLMAENKNVYFKSVGVPIKKFLPRYEYVKPRRGGGWLTDLYPKLNMDIAIAPLEDSIFNKGKSNIKWQEATRAGACFVASRVGPYALLSPDVAQLVPKNTKQDWYKALKRVVDDVDIRKKFVTTAQASLRANWRLEDHWQQYRDMFIKVKGK